MDLGQETKTSDKKSGSSHDVLKRLEKQPTHQRREVVYGLYDGSRQSFSTRIEDFFIDHQHIPLEEKAYFFHLLAVMIDAGIPLIDALKILAHRTKNEHFYRVLTTIGYSMIQGKKLSDSLAQFPDIFGDMEVGIARSGEAAGNLDKMLLRLSEQLDKSHALHVKLITASFYPLAVLGVLVVVASGMLIWVVPSLINLLTEGGLAEKDFPLATRILLGFSNILTQYWWAILSGGFIFYLLAKVYISSDNGRFKWDLFKLKFPVIGTLYCRVLVLRFVSTLGILLEAGLPVVQALNIIATSLTSEIYRLKVWEVSARVQQGERISESLATSSFLFPETVTQMIAVGEQSASIGPICEKVASHYDQEIDNSLKRLTSLFEPVMIIFVGLSVALLALALLLPIFNLSQLV